MQRNVCYPCYATCGRCGWQSLIPDETQHDARKAVGLHHMFEHPGTSIVIPQTLAVSRVERNPLIWSRSA